jgi:hypothetical protein
VASVGRGLDASGIFLALLTPAALASKWVQSETNSAIELEHDGSIRLIPLLVQPCTVPTLLRAYQRVSFISDYGIGLAQLLAALAPSRTEPAEATVKPQPPQHITREPEQEDTGAERRPAVARNMREVDATEDQAQAQIQNPTSVQAAPIVHDLAERSAVTQPRAEPVAAVIWRQGLETHGSKIT